MEWQVGVLGRGRDDQGVGWEEDNKRERSLMQLVFSTSIREIIFLTSKKLDFLETNQK